MKPLAILSVLIAALVGQIQYATANGACNAQATANCMDGTGKWVEGGKCNAIYGNILGNKGNLQALMKTQLEDSFKLMLMVMNMKRTTKPHQSYIRIISRCYLYHSDMTCV